jgi:hypothetical protein
MNRAPYVAEGLTPHSALSPERSLSYMAWRQPESPTMAANDNETVALPDVAQRLFLIFGR